MIRDRRENVGTLEAYIRVSGGLVLLAIGASGKLGRLASWAVLAAGAAAVASGVTRYCPLVEAMEGRTAGGDEGEIVKGAPEAFQAERSPEWDRRCGVVRDTETTRESETAGREEEAEEMAAHPAHAAAREGARRPRRALTRRV